MKCPYCKRGKLKYIGNKIYECNVCIRGSFQVKNKKKLKMKYKKRF